METVSPWGAYAPNSKTYFLRFLTASGLGRGKMTKKIGCLWRRYQGERVDIKIRGVKYRLNLRDNVTDSKLLSSSKEHDRTELNALKDACRGGVFVDAGANIGYYSLALAVSGATSVLAIEPNPPTLARLRFNVKINGLDKTVTTVPTGIGPQGTSELFSTGDLGSASLIKGSSDKKTSVTIQTRPLLDIIRQQNLEKIDGMKIDVEGMEDRALMPFFAAAPKSLWPACLVVEHCHKKDWQTDIISHLLGTGYVLAGKTRSNTILKLR